MGGRGGGHRLDKRLDVWLFVDMLLLVLAKLIDDLGQRLCLFSWKGLYVVKEGRFIIEQVLKEQDAGPWLFKEPEVIEGQVRLLVAFTLKPGLHMPLERGP